MRKIHAVAPATGRIVDATRLVSGARAGWLLIVVATLTLVAVLITAAGAEAAATPVRLGDPADVHHVLPGLMAPWNTHPVDLDGDTSAEFIITSGDGVMQKYDANGRFVWGLDTQTIATELDVLAENSGHFIGPRKNLLPTTDTGIVFLDVNADGVLDIITSAYIALDAPHNEVKSALLQVDGRSGQILDVSLRGGFIHHILSGDFDPAPGAELLIVEEDGPRHLNAAGTYWIGTNGTTRLYVERLDGTTGWSHDTARGWGQVTAIVRARLDNTAPDVTFALTESFDQLVHDLEDRPTHFDQDLVALDGDLGTVLWTKPTGDYVREIVRVANPGNPFDMLLRIQEPAGINTDSRGDDRGHVQLLRGTDGTSLWSTAGEMGRLPRVHDAVVRTSGVATVAVAYTTEAASPYSAEQQVEVQLRRLTDGVLVDNIRLAGNEPPELTLVGGLVNGALGGLLGGPSPVQYPADLSTTPTVHGMNLLLSDLDADAMDDLVIGNDRGITGVLVGGSGLSTLWHTAVPADRDIFFKIQPAGGAEIWTQDVQSGRLQSFRASDGSHIRDTPLVTMMFGVARADLAGDGGLDRIVGGTSGTVFAFENATHKLLWQRSVGRHVLDLKTTDVNGDARPDVVWIGDREAGAVSSSGAVLWTHRHAFADDGGEYRDWKYADLNNDGVPDLVISYRSGSNGGTGATRLASVFALDGKTGAALWTHTLPPPIWSANGLDVRDIDFDGVPDVAYTTQTAAQAAYYGVGVLNGANGLLKWRVDLALHGGQNVLEAHSVVIADADGDSQMDVIVPTRGGLVSPASLRAHHGPTGVLLWEKPIDQSSGLRNEGIWRGRIGPAGAESLLVQSQDPTTNTQRLSGLTTRGGPIYHHEYPGLLIITDIQLGDIGGDGIDDIAIASPQGLVVLDSGPTLGGTPRHLGHITAWSPTKVRLFDSDADGKQELEFLSDPQNWPVHVGPLRLIDLGRGKSTGTADMDAFVPPPINQPPVASFVALANPVVQHVNVTLRSTSFDPDGTVVSERWVLPGGREATGNEVNHTFTQAGAQNVRLEVMDNFGKVTTLTRSLDVRPVYGFTLQQARAGTAASPGGTFNFTFTVNNTGATSDKFTARIASTPADWTASLDQHVVTLAPGQNRTFTVTTQVMSPLQRGDLVFEVNSTAGGVTKSLTHRFAVALEVQASLFNGAGPYGPDADIGGVATVRWSDGTPVSGVPIRVSYPGSARPDRIDATDADGRISFLIEKDLMVAHTPGDKRVVITPEVAGYGTSKTLYYTVGLLPS